MLANEPPQKFSRASDAQVHEIIEQHRKTLGQKVLILGHHYQRQEVMDHVDFAGDSLRLATFGKDQKNATHIIFCGVHFMAETCDILKAEKQAVYLPDVSAGCDMATMADTSDVLSAWRDLRAASVDSIVPITYVNSAASLKAFVGDNGGIVCTSGNAGKIIKWGLERARHLFFFPDEHLGRNTCKKLGLDTNTDMLVWDPVSHLGGHPIDTLRAKRIWLWKGHCPVHVQFTVSQIEKFRKEEPQTRIIVHPECTMEIVDLADAVGSTEFIINTVTKSPPGSSWAVGTEINLIERLARMQPDKTIKSLNPYTCVCSMMNRISLRHLAWVLDDLVAGNLPQCRITVPDAIATSARLALNRMFELS